MKGPCETFCDTACDAVFVGKIPVLRDTVCMQPCEGMCDVAEGSAEVTLPAIGAAAGAAGTTITNPLAPALLDFLMGGALAGGGAGAVDLQTDNIDPLYALRGIADAVASDVEVACSTLETSRGLRLSSSGTIQGQLQFSRRALLQKAGKDSGL